jgi:predicted histone-like DNA-binding protein
MSIKFKSVERGQPGVVGGGTKLWYAQIVFNEEITMDMLVKEIEKFSALSEPDIRGVAIALENVIQDKLANGHIVRLDKLGSFYPSISSSGSDIATKVKSTVIRKVGVNYRPGKRILDTMKAAGFVKEGEQ